MWWFAVGALAGPLDVDGIGNVGGSSPPPGPVDPIRPSPDADGDDVIVQPVVAGEVDFDEEYPATVFVEIRNGNVVGNCTGVLVDPEHVLTAAHCLDFPNPSSTSITVLVGLGQSEGWTSERSVVSWITHPDFVDIENDDPDLAVLRLGVPLLSPEPVPVNAQPLSEFWTGVELELAGYGRVGNDAPNPGGLRRFATADIFAVLPNTFIVEDPVQNLCQGDSGGALFRATEEGLEVVGIASFVINGCEGGAAGAARVDTQLDWLQEQIPGLRLSTAPPPATVPRPLDTLEGPNAEPPTASLPEWEEPTAPSRGLHGGPLGCSQGALPLGAVGTLTWLVLLAWRRRA